MICVAVYLVILAFSVLILSRIGAKGKEADQIAEDWARKRHVH